VVKAVFFDWFNTLAHYDPPREELQSQALREFNINISPVQLLPGILVADREYFEENTVNPVRQRSPEDQAKVFTRYQKTVLEQAGSDISPEPETLLKIMTRVQQLAEKISFVLFDDVLPTLKILKQQNLVMGLLTNLDSDMKPICLQLGLEPYLNFIITSGEVGSDKPHPPIFQGALRQAGVDAAAAVHVGDQYQTDVIGARGVGITPVLLDRYQLSPEVDDCPKISSLTELIEYLDLDVS